MFLCISLNNNSIVTFKLQGVISKLNVCVSKCLCLCVCVFVCLCICSAAMSCCVRKNLHCPMFYHREQDQHDHLTMCFHVYVFATALIHWGRMTHICVSNLTVTGLDDGLSPGRCQAIIWTNDGILLFRPSGTNFSENLIEILTCVWKCRLKNGDHFVSASMCLKCIWKQRLKSSIIMIMNKIHIDKCPHHPSRHVISDYICSPKPLYELGIVPVKQKYNLTRARFLCVAEQGLRQCEKN